MNIKNALIKAIEDVKEKKKLPFVPIINFLLNLKVTSNFFKRTMLLEKGCVRNLSLVSLLLGKYTKACTTTYTLVLLSLRA